MEMEKLVIGQEFLIASELFRVLKYTDRGYFVARVLQSGALASHKNPSNYGTYTQDQIDYYFNLGAMRHQTA